MRNFQVLKRNLKLLKKNRKQDTNRKKMQILEKNSLFGKENGDCEVIALRYQMIFHTIFRLTKEN